MSKHTRPPRHPAVPAEQSFLSSLRKPDNPLTSQLEPRTDELDALLNLETTFENEGRADATQAGAKAGELDGYELGWKSGASLSAELEFMHGAASTLLALSKKHDKIVPPRALTYATDLVSKSTPPLAELGNDATLDMESHATELRALFRRMIALAGLPTVRYEARGSRLADLSF